MSETYADSPAFPVETEFDMSTFRITSCSGLTMRQWYAGMALPAVLDTYRDAGEGWANAETRAHLFASKAFEIADAMIKQGMQE